MKKRVAGFLTVLGIAVCLALYFCDFGQTVPALDGSTITVVPGVHLLGEVGPAAVYVVESSDGLILIDAGLESDAYPVKSQMAKLGLDWKKCRAILLTHAHGDHCGGAERLRTSTGAMVYAGEADVPVLRAGDSRDAIFSTYDLPKHTPHPTTVDVSLNGRETLEFGDVRILVLATPGHTPGSICYLMERAGLRVLFAGDVIQGLGEQPLGTYSTYLAPRYRGDAKSYMASLQMLRDLPVPDLVLPGHPNSSQEPHSPRLTQQQWTATLDAGIDEMHRLVSRFEADGANFLDGHPKRLLPELYYLGDFEESAVYGLFTASSFFVVAAPGGPGLSDFLQTRLRELGREPAQPTAILLTACGESETAGLKELVERSGAQVVASPAGVAAIRQLCPPDTVVLTADELPAQNWFPVTSIPLGGRGESSIAYLVECAGKNVLFSGTIPAGIDTNTPQELIAELLKSKPNAVEFNAAVQRLADVRPDLWLPRVPLHGQNANLYGGEWKEVLEKNKRVVEHIMQSPHFRAQVQP